MVWATKASRAGAPHPHKVSCSQPVFLTCVAQSIQQLCLHVLQLLLDLVQPEGELLWVTLCWSNQTAELTQGWDLRVARFLVWANSVFEQAAPLLCAVPGCPARAVPTRSRYKHT